MSGNPGLEATTSSRSDKLRVVIAGGGVAALETTLALADLAPERTDVTVVAPNSEFVYRPMVVREPFAYGAAHRYPLAPIVHDAGAKLITGELGWIDPVTRTIHTKADDSIEYDALMLALEGTITKRYPHALTIDDRDQRRAPISNRPHHGRARVQLEDHRHADLLVAEQDRCEIPRALPGETRPRKYPDLT